MSNEFYKNLLKKYIQHVEDIEGCDFISNSGKEIEWASYVEFTKEEEEELLKLRINE